MRAGLCVCVFAYTRFFCSIVVSYFLERVMTVEWAGQTIPSLSEEDTSEIPESLFCLKQLCQKKFYWREKFGFWLSRIIRDFCETGVRVFVWLYTHVFCKNMKANLTVSPDVSIEGLLYRSSASYCVIPNTKCQDDSWLKRPSRNLMALTLSFMEISCCDSCRPKFYETKAVGRIFYLSFWKVASGTTEGFANFKILHIRTEHIIISIRQKLSYDKWHQISEAFRFCRIYIGPLARAI